MGFVDNIVKINIVQQTSTVATTTTTIPLLLGTTNPGWDSGDYVHLYTSAADMLADGFEATSPEYVYALSLTAQNTVPNEFLVGRRQGAGQAAVAQVDEVTMPNTNSIPANHLYKLAINGTVYSYTSGPSDGINVVLSGLLASINNDANAVVTPSITGGGGTLVLTAKVGGQGVTYSQVDSGLTLTNETESAGATADTLSVADLSAVQGQNDSWYALILVHGSDAEIETAAAWIQPQKKTLFVASSTAEIAEPQSTSDVLATLMSKNYSRTSLTFSPLSAGLGIEAGWVGGQLPATPGYNTWMFKEILGIASDNLTSAQIEAVAGVPVNGTSGKNGNVYVNGMMQQGRMVSGDFIDNIIGVDWLYFNLSSSVFGMLKNAPGKVPYTDAGVAMLISAVRAVLGQARDNGLIAADYDVTAPKVATVPLAQRANRIAPTITFTATLQAAVHAVSISGTVSV